jgi:hypothetical protein
VKKAKLKTLRLQGDKSIPKKQVFLLSLYRINNYEKNAGIRVPLQKITNSVGFPAIKSAIN